MKHIYTSAVGWWPLIWIALFLPYSVAAQSSLQLSQPTYYCETGLIIFNTVGGSGNGTPITYSANGVSLTSPSSNTGIVNQGSRNSPITIQATQSGTTVQYTFDLPKYCSDVNTYGPVLKTPIPDTTLSLDMPIFLLDIAQYFGPPPRTGYVFTASGLPQGTNFNTGISNQAGYPPVTEAYIVGVPQVLGTYTVTVMVSSKPSSQSTTYSVAATFKITVVPTRTTTPPPPTPVPLALAKPTYYCETGLIIFSTTGGDGTPVTYSANGVTLTPPSSNTGVVSQGARNGTLNIQAVQSGKTAQYSFDLPKYCSDVYSYGPVLKSPIPDTTLSLDMPLFLLDIGKYFDKPRVAGTYPYVITYSASGLPRGTNLGMGTIIYPDGSTAPNADLVGVPQVLGTYSVTLIVTSKQPFQDDTYPIVTTFKITVVPTRTTTPPTSQSLALVAPTYDCATGAITFKTTGGNGTPIEFMAIGITPWTTNPNQTIDAAKRADRNSGTVIRLMARQSGVVVFYDFDYGYCPTSTTPTNPSGNSLALTAPTYNCATGAFTFNTTGGNGSPIEYRAVPGITDWTTNPNQFVDKESRTANDVQPFLLQARQNGVVTTLVWNLKAACGRARQGVDELSALLEVSILGNPVTGQAVDIEVQGAPQQSLRVQLIDLQGQIITEQRINQASTVERMQLQLNKSAGIYLLQVSSPGQTKTLRVLKVN